MENIFGIILSGLTGRDWMFFMKIILLLIKIEDQK